VSLQHQPTHPSSRGGELVHKQTKQGVTLTQPPVTLRAASSNCSAASSTSLFPLSQSSVVLTWHYRPRLQSRHAG
jgi:hypothetical protein